MDQRHNDDIEIIQSYVMTNADRQRINRAFNGDPLSFIDSEGERMYVSQVTENLPDRDEYRKKMALGAYFTVHNPGSNFSFNLANMDQILESFYKKKMSVDAAYQDLCNVLNPPKKNKALEYAGNLAEEDVKKRQNSVTEHLAAAGSGAVSFSSNMAMTFLKLGKWGTDIYTKLLSPVMSEEQQKFVHGLGKLYEEVAKSYVKKGNEDYIKALDVTADANENFVMDLFKGDFDKVSVTDFTKALMKSTPDMAFQIGLAAISPYALPAYVGVQTAALKDYEVQEKQPEWGNLKKWSYIGLSAANEALFEMVTAKILGGKMTKEAGKEIIRKGLWKYIGKSFAKEGASEAIQQLDSNILDLLYDLEGDTATLSGKELLERTFNGVGEAGFIGGVWGVPEGYAGFNNAREMIGFSEEVRRKYEEKVETLSQKEDLTPEEKRELSSAEKIINSNDPGEIITLDHLEQKVREADTDEEILHGEDFARIRNDAAEEATDQQIIDAVRSERNIALDKAMPWNTQDVADKVQEYSKIFRDTKFHIVESWADLPAYNIPENHPGGAFTDVRSGDIYINAAKVRPNKILETIIHEVVGHKGLRAVVPDKQLNDLLDSVYLEHGEEDLFQEIAGRYLPDAVLENEYGEKSLAIDRMEDQRFIAEEYVAFLAQKNTPKPSWWKEFIQKIRMFLSRLPGFENVRMTTDQIETVLARSARNMRKNWYNRRSSVIMDVASQDYAGASGEIQNNTDKYGNVRNGTDVADLPDGASGEIRFAIDRDMEDENLIVMHNVTAAKLRKAAKLGGLPVPSLAIVDAEKSNFDNFGEISLIADKSLIDPKMKSNKVYNADIYSPRMPEIIYEYTQSDFDRAYEKIKPFETLDPEDRNSLDKTLYYFENGMTDRDFADALKSLPATQKWYSNTNNEDLDFDTWWESVALPELNFSQNGKIFNGYTPSGKRKWLPANLENIVKLMTKKVRNGEGFNYGIGNIRSMKAKQFKSIADIKKSRNNIVSEETFKQIKKDIQEEYQQLEGDMRRASSDNGYSWGWNTGSDSLLAMAEGGRDNIQYLEDRFGDDPEILDKMAAFLDKLVNMPTEYFEAKPQRAVGVNEFRAAVVPEDLPADVRKILEDAGLEIYTYGKTPRKAALQMATMDNDLRFSLAEYSEEQIQDYVNILKPFVGVNLDMKEEKYRKYLKEKGVDIPDEDADLFFRMAIKENRAEILKASLKKNKQDAYNYWRSTNPLIDYLLDFTGDDDFYIVPTEQKGEAFTGSFIAPEYVKWSEKRSQRKNESDKAYREYLRKREEKLASAQGYKIDELAEQYSRHSGKDYNEVLNEIAETFRDLKKKDILSQWKKYKEENFARTREEAEEAARLFEDQERERIEEEVVDILTHGMEVTQDWIDANRDVYKELYRKVMKKDPPHNPGKLDLETLNAAINQESSSADDYAEAYRKGREESKKEYMEKLREFREKLMQKNAEARELQILAEKALKDLRPEIRGLFTGKIMKLLDYTTTPNAKYPEGRRQYEFDELLKEMAKKNEEERKKIYFEEIKKMLSTYRISRTYKGIPVSKIPSTQQYVTEISRILHLTAGSLQSYRNLQQQIMSDSEEGSDVWLNARIKIEYSNLFGNMEQKSSKEMEKAKDVLAELILKGKNTLKDIMLDRLEEVNRLRHNVIFNLNHGNIDTTDKDAARFNKFLLLNRATLESLLRLTANKKITEFENTVQSDMVMEYEYAQEQEKTQLREFDNDFHKAVLDITGYKGVIGFKKFLDELNAPITGIFRNIYTAKIENIKREPYYLVGKRPAIRQKVNWKIAEYVFDKYADDIKAVYRNGMTLNSAKREFYKFGNIEDDYAVFLVGKDLKVFSWNMDNDMVTEFDIDSRALPNSYYPLPINDISKRYAKKQVEDVAAGVIPVREEFADEAQDVQYQALNDADRGALEIEFIADSPNTECHSNEIENLTLNKAIQLILEYEQQDYKDTFEWNGFDKGTIAALYKAIPEKYLRFAYWAREYLEKHSEKLDKVTREKYGIGIPRIPLYFPGAFEGISRQKTAGNGLDKTLGSMSMNPSFLIARKGHLKAPDTNAEFLYMFTRHIMQQIHFVENNNIVSKLRSVFNESKVKQSINSVLGKNVTNEILRRIGEYASGGGMDSNEVGSVYLSRFAKFFAASKIGFSIPSMLKQGAGVIAFSYNIPFGAFIKYTAKVYSGNKDFRQFAKMAWKSDFLQNRYAGGLDKDLVYMINHAINSENYSVLSNMMLDAGSMPMRIGDVFSTITGGYTVYAYTRDQALKNGATEQEAVKKAEYAWMKATNETQQGSNITSQNYFMANPTAWRVFTLFRSNAIQTMDLVLRTLDEVKLAGYNKKTAKKLARQLAVSHIFIPASMFLVSQIWSKGIDIEEWNWEELAVGMLLGSWEGILFMEFLKTGMNKISRIAMNKPFFSRNTAAVPLLDSAGNAIDTFYKLFKDDELSPKDLLAGVQSLGDLMMVSGMAYTPAGNIGAAVSALGMRAKQIFKWFEEKEE